MPVLLPLVLGGLFVAALEIRRRYRMVKKGRVPKKKKAPLSPPRLSEEGQKPRIHIEEEKGRSSGKRPSGPHSKTEEKCRRIIESIYGLPFPPCERFVINSRTSTEKKKNYLTLDGYNPSLRIAFEYQGPQHYHYPNYLSRQGKMTREQFLEGIERDRLKKAACKAAGITLLIIPYTEDKNLEDCIHSMAP